MPDRRYISVIVPLRLEWEPCYSVPAAGDMPGIGDRVRVRVGPREYVGVVSGIDVEPQVAPEKIRDIVRTERGLSPVSTQELSLWRAVAEYYMCSIGEVYKAAYPAQKILNEETAARQEEKERERLRKRAEARQEKTERLRKRLEDKEKRLAAKEEAIETAAGRPLKNGGEEAAAKRMAKLGGEADRLHEEIARLRNELSALENGEKTAEEAVEASGAYRTHEDAVRLTPAQDAAYRKILEAFGAGKPALLTGVTGSGKTEIYMKLAAECLDRGQNVLYLVPEIALSRQLEMRLEDFFGDRLTVFHSAETVAKRRETASRVRYGSGYVVLGTRSAVFLPHHDLGLIIVDEEHDSSYKQDSPAPRYNGRDTAVMLAAIQKCRVILGSATPALESLHNCETGKFALVELTVRYHETEDAQIEIIDTIAERKKRGMRGSFSLKLIDRISETLANGEQVMLFRSRRSFSPAVQCTECGYIPRCPHCNVSLSLHKSGRRQLLRMTSGQETGGQNGRIADGLPESPGTAAEEDTSGRLVCHHCGFSMPSTGKCPECGGTMRGLGSGTQKIEEEAAAMFPQARIARLDSDTAQSATYGKETIRKFTRGEIDILIGTQMVTKGFDFPTLSLVAVMQADTLLSVQDFRADEKAVQLLEQFRGRCGRRGRRGLFVIQTATPKHPVYDMLSEQQGIPGMKLLDERRQFGFPPFTREINIIIRDPMESRAERLATKLAGILESLGLGYDLTGPYSPAVDKINDSHIRIIRLDLKKDRTLTATKRTLMKVLGDFETKEKYAGHLIIDVDPA